MSKKITLLALLLATLITSAQWSTNSAENLLVANRVEQTSQQTTPKIARMANGSTYISWFELTTNGYLVRLQLLDKNGNKLFGTSGLLISSHPQNSWLTDYTLQADNDNNAIVIFPDIRTGSVATVNAYKISQSGTFLWGADGLGLSSGMNGDNMSVQSVITAANKTAVAWSAYNQNSDSSAICLTLLNSDGTYSWPEQVKRIVNQTGDGKEYGFPKLLKTNNESFILHYSSLGTGPGLAQDRELFARKYNQDGSIAWNKTICNRGGMQFFVPVSLIHDGSGGVVASWSDFGATPLFHAYLQHIKGDGTAVFADNGLEVVPSQDSHHFSPVVGYNSSSQLYYLSWRKTSSSQGFVGISAQKINAQAERLWGDEGKEIFPLSEGTMVPGMITPMADGNSMLLYSIDPVLGSINSYINAIKLDSNGNPLWTPQQKPIASSASAKSYLEVESDEGAKSWIIAWSDPRNHEDMYDTDIYIQNIDDNGLLGQTIPTGIENEVTKESVLLSNYPNPFNPETTISFNLTNAGAVALTVYNNKGEQVQQLVNSSLSAGLHSIKFNAAGLNSGVYFYKLTANGINQTQKMLLCK